MKSVSNLSSVLATVADGTPLTSRAFFEARQSRDDLAAALLGDWDPSAADLSAMIDRLLSDDITLNNGEVAICRMSLLLWLDRTLHAETKQWLRLFVSHVLITKCGLVSWQVLGHLLASAASPLPDCQRTSAVIAYLASLLRDESHASHRRVLRRAFQLAVGLLHVAVNAELAESGGLDSLSDAVGSSPTTHDPSVAFVLQTIVHNQHGFAAFEQEARAAGAVE